MARIAWQRLVLPERQNLHLPHSGVERNHVVAHRHRGDALADRLDDAAALMAENGRKDAFRIGAREVKASVWQTPVAWMRTNTSPASRRRDIDFGDFQWLACGPGDGGAGSDHR